ncbi:motile sperm domain-containing protein 2-like, partial [Stegodyphus dumicola]|uniref:motile sperm domain-containing protein 2-like n=1 Tax=Stegodyphus dumicola TaxID=202533 RepID=UPI0015B18D64
VNQASIPIEFFQAKAVFPFNKDREGNPIIMILVRYHRKVPEFIRELRRFVIYWVELMEEQTKGGQMTVIMSCAGAGLSNLDLDLIKFLITLFRSYYPHSLAHILIYELPWILSPAWKIIKQWLPEDFVEKIKFVNKTSIQDYVSEDNLPLEMGGTDTTEYEPPCVNEINSNGITEPKHVHFSHNHDSLRGVQNIANGHISIPKEDASHVLITDDYTIIGGILKICPATELVFHSPSNNSSNDVAIKLICVAEKAVTYKVKTNNIESYRVKPSIGIIEAGSTIEINVVLLPGFHPQPTDKFLIMAMEVSESTLSTTSLGTLWKSSPSDIIADHKLKCVMKKDDQSMNEELDVEKTLKTMQLCISNIENKLKILDTRQSSLQIAQYISLFLISFLTGIYLCNLFLSDDSPVISFLKQF